MRKAKKALAVGLTVAMSMTMLAGCGDKESSGGSSSKGGSKVDELYLYNSKGENAEAFEAMGKAYSEETGIKVKTFSIGSGTDHMETLRAEMNSKNKPAVFTVQTLSELQEWEEGGFALDFNNATVDEFKKLADEIPEGLRLTTDGKNSYGVPYNVEGYGYICDTQMISDIFGEANKDAVLAAMKTATYDEWEAGVKTLEEFATKGTTGKVTYSGQEFEIQEKTGLAKNLTGVFSVAGSEKWTYGDHMINVAINAVFPNPAAAKAATDEEVDSLKGAFVKYAQALDLKTSNAAGDKGALKRGNEMINATTNGYDASVQKLADGKAIFLKQGNWVYTNVEKVNKEVAQRITFLPVKLPVTADDIKVEGLTPEKMNSSIPVFVPMYYAVNAKASKAEQEAAQDFLVWLNTSETGKKFITEDFAFIPYNADPATTKVNNCLGTSILEYLQEGNTLSNPYAGAPSNWSGETVGLEIMEKYLTKEKWDQSDYEAIADYAIKTWKEMK